MLNRSEDTKSTKNLFLASVLVFQAILGALDEDEPSTNHEAHEDKKIRKSIAFDAYILVFLDELFRKVVGKKFNLFVVFVLLRALRVLFFGVFKMLGYTTPYPYNVTFSF